MIATKSTVVPATLAFARGVLTRGTDVFGPEEIAKALGIPVKQIGEAPPLPFSEAEIVRARELSQYLILMVDKTADGKLLTMKRIHQMKSNRLLDGKLLYNTDWYKSEAFFTDDTPTAGWRLVSREVIPDSASTDYIGQTQALADYLREKVFKGEELPEAYQAAVDEFEKLKNELEELRDTNWEKCAKECAALKMSQLFREKPVEVLLGLAVNAETNREWNLGGMYAWTNQRSSGGGLVVVGDCDSYGVRVVSGGPGGSPSDLGVRFSRSAVPN